MGRPVIVDHDEWLRLHRHVNVARGILMASLVPPGDADRANIAATEFLDETKNVGRGAPGIAVFADTFTVGFKAGIEEAAKKVLSLKICGCNGSHGQCTADDPYDHAASEIRTLTTGGGG